MQLIHRSDVLIENYLPGKLAKYGLDYKTVSQIRPSLVYCSITGRLCVFNYCCYYKSRDCLSRGLIKVTSLFIQFKIHNIF